ncbi:MAG: ketopantoate reductase family protein [Sphaerochaetaceae bacterium]|jgi:2-dehydropantoate 2-reductase
MNVAIYGAGSLGTILGAYIAKGGRDIDLVNRNPKHVQALRTDGAHVVGTVDFKQKVNALFPSEMSKRYDIIFLMTKQLGNKAVVESLVPHLADDGVICTTQNGLPELSVSEVIGEDRTFGCTIAWGATLVEPGVSELTSSPDALTFGLGSMTGKDSQRLHEIKELLELMGPVTIEKNFIGARWSKLLINSAFSGLSACLGQTFGEVAKAKKSRRVAQRILKECIDVTVAAHVKIEPIQGKDVAKLLDYHGPIKKWVSFRIIPLAMKKHALLKASMLQDLEKGKKTEIDAINGVVCAYGRKVGVPTPFNDKVVEIVHGIEDGTYASKPSNIELFTPLL